MMAQGGATLTRIHVTFNKFHVCFWNNCLFSFSNYFFYYSCHSVWVYINFRCRLFSRFSFIPRQNLTSFSPHLSLLFIFFNLLSFFVKVLYFTILYSPTKIKPGTSSFGLERECPDGNKCRHTKQLRPGLLCQGAFGVILLWPLLCHHHGGPKLLSSLCVNLTQL